MNTKKENRLYILIREDLSNAQKAVQAGHAIAQWMIEHHHKHEWHNGTLIYLTVPDEQVLTEWFEVAQIKQLPCSCFREPDMNDQMTAIAILADEKSKKMFAKLPMML